MLQTSHNQTRKFNAQISKFNKTQNTIPELPKHSMSSPKKLRGFSPYALKVN